MWAPGRALAELIEEWKKIPPASRNMLLPDAKHRLQLPRRGNLEDLLGARYRLAAVNTGGPQDQI